MNMDETAHELSFNIIKPMFHHFIARNRYYFDAHTFFGQHMNKMSLEAWKLCRHKHGHHNKADSSIADIVVMKKKDEIIVHDHKKTSWIDLYPQDSNGDDSDLQLSHSSLHICMIELFCWRI